MQGLALNHVSPEMCSRQGARVDKVQIYNKASKKEVQWEIPDKRKRAIPVNIETIYSNKRYARPVD